MKKLLLFLLLSVTTITIGFSQSKIGKNHFDILNETINSKSYSENKLIEKPKYSYYRDGNFNMTLIFTNFIGVYTFTKNDECIQIILWTPLMSTKQKIIDIIDKTNFLLRDVENSDTWIEYRMDYYCEWKVFDLSMDNVNGFATQIKKKLYSL